jgi:selenocysteine-specific elongation factor
LVAENLVNEIPVSPTRTVCLHRRVFGQFQQRIKKSLDRAHDRNPLMMNFDEGKFAAEFDYAEPAVFWAALEELIAEQVVVRTGSKIGLRERGPQLSHGEQKLLDQLVEIFRKAGIESPTVKECQQQATKNQQSVPELLKLAAGQGGLVEIAPDYFIHLEVEHRVRDTLRNALADGRGLTVSEIRELLNTTRKFAVPLCEYLDRIEFTKRQGDLRVLADAGKS